MRGNLSGYRDTKALLSGTSGSARNRAETQLGPQNDLEYSLYLHWVVWYIFHTKRMELGEKTRFRARHLARNTIFHIKSAEKHTKPMRIVNKWYLLHIHINLTEKRYISIEMGDSGGPENPISGRKSSPKCSFVDILWKKLFKTQVNNMSMESTQSLGYVNIILHTNKNRGPSWAPENPI